MEFVKMTLDADCRHYSYQDASSIQMSILGCFFLSEIRCTPQRAPTYQDWAVDDSLGMGLSGNITFLEKLDDLIALSDLYSEEAEPTELRLSRQQFIQLLNEWEETVCKCKPKEVTIKQENGQFTIETSD